MSVLELREYQAAWPQQAATVERELTAALEGYTHRIEHIGSTSVTGLPAKPVLDMLLGIQELADVEARLKVMDSLGYRYRPEYENELPERRYFVREQGALPKIHLHAVQIHGRLWNQHLVFREALRGSPRLAASYASLKLSLVALHAGDKAAYTAAKAPFIQHVLAQAVPGAA